MLRNLWLRHNAFLFENKFKSPKMLLSAALQQSQDFQAATKSHVTSGASQDSTGVCRWQATQALYLKLNWDAAVFNSASGFGGLVRDTEGEVILSFCSFHNANLDPTMAEAMTLRKAMQISWELYMSNIVFEGDCLQVVDAASSHLPRYDALGPIFFDIHHMLDRAHNWTVIHTPRYANRATHGLAKFACILSTDVIWMEDSPDSILNVILENKLCINFFDE